jgi:hypothetical protein
MVRITVEDSGIGIPIESRQQLFKQFSQVQRMTVGGSGLGLYSLSKRSEAIGGSCGVDCRSDGKQGSSFWFEFPYRPDTLMDSEQVSVIQCYHNIEIILTAIFTYFGSIISSPIPIFHPLRPLTTR